MPTAVRPLDIMKEHADEYAAGPEPRFVDTAPASYLTITGRGAPGGPEFADAAAALYAVAYTVKMARKRVGPLFTVSKLEGLWWADDDTTPFLGHPRDTWNWKILIRVPEQVTTHDLTAAAEALAARGKSPAVRRVTLERIDEGRCVQVLHVGPYAAEGPAVERMHRAAQAAGLRLRGRHHEIYLSDPRRVAPEKVRTILRHPVR